MKKDLIENLLARDERSRMQSLGALVSHPFFEGFGWDDLRAGLLPPPEDIITHVNFYFTLLWNSEWQIETEEAVLDDVDAFRDFW